MKRSLFFIAVLTAILAQTGLAQFSVYGSLSYGFDGNALSNYLQTPDQLRQGYLQLGYAIAAPKTIFDVTYAGGLAMYRSLEGRNYLEQSVKLRYQNRWAPALPAKNAVTNEDGEEESEAEEAEQDEDIPDFNQDDPAVSIVEWTLTPSARIDKGEFAEFDNSGVEGGVEYRFSELGGVRLTLHGTAAMRRYPNVPLLSNWVLAGSLKAEAPAGTSWHWGGSAGYHQKLYTETVVDTSIFQVALSQSSGQGRGKGKSGGSGSSGSGKAKKVLLQATSRSASQVAFAAFAEYRHAESVLHLEAGYRWNPKNTARRIAQDAAGSLLTDDLYSDYFSWEGPEASASYSAPLMTGLRGALTVRVERKDFGTPALDVLGDVLAAQRADTRGAIEIALTRSVPLGGNVSMDVGVTGTVMRNISNDEYNDFSASGLTFSVGIGF